MRDSSSQPSKATVVVEPSWRMVKSPYDFAINGFRAAMVFDEGVNLHQGYGALDKAHYLSLHHLHDLMNERECECWLIFVHVHTFTSQTPVTRSLKEESGELRLPHDRFGSDLIQISRAAFHPRLLIIVPFIYHA